MLDEIREIKSGAAELREFGALIGAILIVMGDVALARGRPASYCLLGAGIVFIASGFFAPAVLKPFQKAWMALGLIIGFFVSRVILAVLFYGVITPIGLCMKLSGKDVLDQRIDRNKSSYWHVRTGPARPPASYENQY